MAARSSAWSLLGILAVFVSQFAWVKATNFGGTDEWLTIDLTSRNIIGIPYANRPFVLLWGWLPAQLLPHRLAGFAIAHAAYLVLSGWLVLLLCRRLARGSPLLGFLAGVFSVTWAPLDYMRLDAVLLTGYSGFTLGAFLAIATFLESWRRASVPLLALAATAAFVTARGFEGVLPLLAGAPLLLALTTRDRSRRFAAWIVSWAALLAMVAAMVAVPFLSRTESYQRSALGLDPHLPRVVGRLLRQYGYHLSPLWSTPVLELAVPAVPLTLVVFGLSYAVVSRSTLMAGGGTGSRREHARLLALGLLLAGLAYSLFGLSDNIVRAARTQVLSSPGIGIALAAAIGLASTLLPSRSRRVAVALLAGWIVAVGAGRTVAMQREWDEGLGRFEIQRSALSQLTSLAPRLAPHTLVVLVDEAQAFWASFTFRHAVAYVYDGQAIGYVPHAQDFLYPTRFRPEGIVCIPAREIQEAWGSTPSLHRYDETVVVRMEAGGRLSLQETWPESLPPLPAGADYAPSTRIHRDGPLPAQRAILRGWD